MLLWLYNQKPKLSITKHPPSQLFFMEVLVLALGAIFDYMEWHIFMG
jgi:hypothetical protein